MGSDVYIRTLTLNQSNHKRRQIDVFNSPQQETPVTLVTETYIYMGNLATGGKRLQDILNDSLTDYLNLSKVEVATSIDGSNIVLEVPSAAIVKKHVVLGLLRLEKHEAPIKRQNYRVRRDFCEAAVVIHNLRIQGALHLPRASTNASAVLSRDIKNFFALTDATITNAADNDHAIDVPVVMVNKHALSLFHVGAVGQ